MIIHTYLKDSFASRGRRVFRLLILSGAVLNIFRGIHYDRLRALLFIDSSSCVHNGANIVVAAFVVTEKFDLAL